MGTLNEPFGWQEEDEASEDWTTGHRAAPRRRLGMITSLLLAGVLTLLAWAVPVMFAVIWLRIAAGFGVAWVLFSAVQRAAGMVGWLCTGLAVMLAFLTLLVPDAVALCCYTGASESQEVPLGSAIFLLLTVRGLPSLFGILACAALCHHGAGAGGFVTDLLMRNPLWPGSR